MRKLVRPALVVVPNEMAALRMTEDLGLLLDGRARNLPARDISFLKTAASSRDLAMRRIEALGDCATGKAVALVVSADAMMNRLMPAARFREHIIALDEGARMEPAELMQRLTAAGYERVQLVESRGQCALRGGILDVYPVGEANALRVEFFDDEIDSIRSFDVMTQRSISRRPSAQLYPASETLLDGGEALQAAQMLNKLLKTAQTGKDGNRQKKIEAEFNLIPFDDFLKLAAGEGEQMSPGAARSGLARNFASAVDALETGRSFDGEDSLIPVLMNYSDLPVDYMDDPIVVLDQPERLRERCENRYMEFGEQFAAALERGEGAAGAGGALVEIRGGAGAARRSQHAHRQSVFCAPSATSSRRASSHSSAATPLAISPTSASWRAIWTNGKRAAGAWRCSPAARRAVSAWKRRSKGRNAPRSSPRTSPTASIPARR